jgi:hypothetical protein
VHTVKKYRKYILLAIFAAMVCYWGSDWLLNQFSGPLASLAARKTELTHEIRQVKRQLQLARKAAKEMNLWRAQSLPTDVERARSAYQEWLAELVEHVQLLNSGVDSGEPASHKGMAHATSIGFSAHGRGTLAQLTRFLYDFYSAGHLHQIRSLSITSVSGSEMLELVISIETLVLPNADRKERLSSKRSDRLASDRIEDYQSIVERNLFGVGGSAQVTDYAFLTAVNYVDGQPEAWFSIRTNDSVLKLRRGEQLEVGSFKGTIAAITDTDVIVESEAERWLLTVGENLSQAAALPPEY